MKKPVKRTKSVKSRAAELRRQVEKVSRPPEKQQAMTPAKMRQMLHELQVHQIELEMQKEELQRAQMELESARARYFDLYDLAPVSYCTVNEKGLILEANLTTTALLGVSRDKLIKQPLTRFICKEDQDIYSLHRKKLFDTGEPQTCDLRMTKKAGEIFWANLAATVAEDEDKAKICRVVMKNITERKQVEEELRAEERRFRTLAEQSSDIIVIVNRDGFVIYENPAVERSLGVKTEERIGISIFERIHPDDLKFAKDVFYAFTLNTSSKDIYTPVRQIRLRHQDGSWRTFETVGSKLFQNNIVDAVIINLRDITERKKAEEALKEAELKFRTIFDSASDGIILALANDKKFLIANKTICNMLGYTQEELLKLEISDIHPPESMYYITEQFAKISRKEISILHNIPVIKKDKTFFFTDINSSSICLNGKEYIIGIFRDITERRQAEQALMESEEKYRLLADQSIMGMFIIQNGCIKYSNNATAKITGYSVEEMMNWKPYGYDIVLHPDESSYVMEQARRKQTGDPDVVVNYTWRIITNSGAIKWVDCFSKTISFEGSPADFVMIIDVTEGKTAQEELKMSEANFRLLAENAPDAIFIRTQLKFAYVNNAALKLFGADSPDQLIGQSVMDRFHPDSRELIRERMHLLDEKKMAVPRNEQKYLKLDGTTIDVEASAVPFRYENIDGSLVFIRDITERKKAEERLRESEEKFRLLSDQSLMAIGFIQDGLYKYVNQTYCDITGYTFDEIMRWQPYEFSKLVHPDDLHFVMDQVKKKQSGNPDVLTHYQFRGITKNKETRWLDLYSRSVLYHGQSADLVSFIDVTDHKNAEKDLQDSEELFKNLFRYHAAVKLIIDPDTGCIIDANEAAVKYYGWPREQIMRMKMEDINMLSPDEVKTAMQKVKTSKRYSFEFHHRRADGSIRDVEVFSSNIKVQGKDILHSVIFDITERKRAEEELKNYREHLEELVKERTIKLEAANKELEAFSYSASHDLRAPLRTIDGFSQAILEDYNNKLDAQGKSYLTRIRKATRLMAELIEDMLKLSRITRADMDIAKVNLSNIAHSVIDGLQKSQPQRHVDVRITDSLEEPADPRLIRIVMENLLGNAWKFTEKQPEAKIEFGLIKKDEENVYFVRDNGAGFDMEYADKLFAPFQRLHNIDEYPGTGIGLAIVKRIITRHAGRVWAEAQVGRGATVYFTLQ